jgi:hypothetical protein
VISATVCGLGVVAGCDFENMEPKESCRRIALVTSGVCVETGEGSRKGVVPRRIEGVRAENARTVMDVGIEQGWLRAAARNAPQS